MAERAVVVGVAASRDGRHGVDHRVEGGHAEQAIDQRARHHEPDIDQHDRPGHLGPVGQHLLGSFRGLALEQLHAGDVQLGQHGHGHDDDADAADTLGQAAPQQDAGRHGVETDHDRGSGGGEARHGLEHRVRQAEVRLDDHERHGRRDRGRQPRHVGQDEDLPHGHTRVVGSESQHQDDAGRTDRQGRGQERRAIGPAGDPLSHGGQQHGDAQHADGHADDVQDRLQEHRFSS